MRVSVAKYPALNVGIVTSMASVTKNTGGSRYRVATVLLDSSYQWMASWLFDLLQIFIYQVAISWENWPGVVLSVIQLMTPFSTYFGLLLAKSSQYVGMGQWPLYLLNKCHINRNAWFSCQIKCRIYASLQSRIVYHSHDPNYTNLIPLNYLF